MNTSLKIFQTVPRIIFNRGSIEELGEEAKRLAARRAAVITDIGVVQAGLVQNIESALDKAGIVFQVFDRGFLRAWLCGAGLPDSFSQAVLALLNLRPVSPRSFR